MCRIACMYWEHDFFSFDAQWYAWRKFVFIAETMSDPTSGAGARVYCPVDRLDTSKAGAWQGVLLSCSEPCDACADVER